eukprot:scaffold66681_cov17-Tisochrysis_lutea.AAC.1
MILLLFPVISSCTSAQGSRSNIHYDPYSNLLVVVTGSKHVTLFSPACTPFLAPAALTSDAANHSQINFTQPDFDKNPEFRLAKQQQTQVTMQVGMCTRAWLEYCFLAAHILSPGAPVHNTSKAPALSLQAGDALFIPEGYWHQVDSEGAMTSLKLS